MFGIYLAAWYRLHLLRASARGLPQEVVRGIVDAKPGETFASALFDLPPFPLPLNLFGGAVTEENTRTAVMHEHYTQVCTAV